MNNANDGKRNHMCCVLEGSRKERMRRYVHRANNHVK